ncbi:MAG: acyltransferase, partial [Acidobacteria bacterium]|nr:acyltransferase [Acidobacteriota bacterium]
GELGVRFFFVISGLLITSILMREVRATEHLNLWRFYFRRTLRIFLPYYAFLLVLLLSQLSMQGENWFNLTFTDFAYAFTYTSNYQLERNWNLAHTWSLSVEEQFYLLWPAVLIFVGWRKGLTAAGLLLLLCPAFRMLLFWLWPERIAGIGHQFETVADALAMGCLLAGKDEWPHPVRAFYEWVLHSRLMLAVPFVAVLANATHEHPLSFFFLGHTVINICAALCVDWAIQNSQSLVGRCLNAKPLVWLGVMSYSLYLWQQIFLNRHNEQWFAAFPQNLGFVFLAALLSYWLVERPALHLRQRLEARWFGGSPIVARLEELARPDNLLSFDSHSPSLQVERALRLSAWQAAERAEEVPLENFLPALKRLEENAK